MTEIDPHLLESIARKKTRLDALRPLSGAALLHLQKYYDVELTYTSNAIEGNTLTLRETAELIEHGITIGAKPLKDYLETSDHYAALQWMRTIAAGSEPIGETIILQLHARIVARSRPDIAGQYSPYMRRIAGSSTVFPNPAKVPSLMRELGASLERLTPAPHMAFDAHFRLAAIHPFSDGNGRTARLLMNLLLIRAGFPPISVRPEDRKDYLDALEQASTTGELGPFQTLMHQRLDATLDEYLSALAEAFPSHVDPAGSSGDDKPGR